MKNVWARVSVQVVLWLVLYFLVMPLLAVAELTALHHWNIRHSLSENGLRVFTYAEILLPYILVGAAAAWLSWSLVRKPWDALGAAALVTVSSTIVFIRIYSYSLVHWVDANLKRTFLLSQLSCVLAVLVATALLAWLIQRRERRRSQAEVAA
ncbi:MAG: hypothetical protein ABFE07_04465 [Armatimonadia bacterium]